MGVECFNERSETSLIKCLREEFRTRTSQELFQLKTPCSLEIGSFLFHFDVYSFPWVSRARSFLLIRIQRKGPAVKTPVEGPPETNHEDASLLRLVDHYGLTHREAEIAGMIALGMSNGQLAEHFHISIPTVKFHLQNIRRKMDVSTRTEIIALALENKA
ncbi:MAG: helix-turn-helix transcriptional regulator [Clostridia bacterium]|nr:helix-turn-helix transcriptional regulator [Clostridia bacterium]